MGVSFKMLSRKKRKTKMKGRKKKSESDLILKRFYKKNIIFLKVYI